MKILVLCVVAGVFFGGWPLIMKNSGINYVLAAVMLQIGSLFVFIPFLRRGVIFPVIVIGITMALAAGLMNGIGQLAYQKMLMAVENDSLSKMLTVVVIVQIVIMTTGSWFFYNEPFGWKKIAGVGLAILSVFCLIK